MSHFKRLLQRRFRDAPWNIFALWSYTLLAILFLSEIVLAQNSTYDYIAVSSGPGGGPLAAKLTEAGNFVLLLEAEDD
jgi:hypothetical protein